MNTKLYIGTELADFNEPFNVMFSIGDVRNPEFGNANKTYTLNLPLTKTNKRLLSFITQTDVKSEPSATGRLYLGEFLIISGALKKIPSHSDLFAKVIISSDDWIDDLKGLDMSDLDLSASDHTLTHANVENSWTAAYPVYRYPMIDFGALMSGEKDVTARWLTCDFIPMISIASLIRKILEPYTISSTWLASAYVKDLFILANEKIVDSAFIENKQVEVAVTNDSDTQDSTSVGASSSDQSLLNNVLVLFTTETVDEGSDWSNDTYIVPETGTYKFATSLKLHNNAPAQADFTITSEEVIIKIISVRGATTTELASYTAPSYVATELIEGITYDLATDQYHLEAGDEVSVQLYLSCSVTNNGAVPHDLIIGVKNVASTFENVWTKANRYAGINKAMALDEMLPNMTQIDFLAAIRDIFNLRLWFDKINRTIYIEPWDQFLSSTVVDLTQYIDFENIDTEFISENFYEKTQYKWKNDDSDAAYTEYLKLNTEGPGLKEITFASLLTNAGIQKREHPFSSLITGPNAVIGAWTLQMPRIWEEVPVYPFTDYNRKVSFNTRLVHWDGMTAGLTWYYETETKNTYPKISGVTWTTIYDNYLLKFLHYVDKGKLLTVRVKVIPTFLPQFFGVINTSANEGFRPTYKITIKGIDNYFFLQKITSDGDVAELELILKQ